MIVDVEIESRWYKVQVPDGVDKSMWPSGIIIGPPDDFGLPPRIETRLHNELFHRGLITERDTRKRAHDIQGALQAALKIDVQIIQEAYSTNGRGTK